jgi:large subunit ribosomal protein L15
MVAAQVRLGELAKVEGDEINLETLKKAGLVSKSTKQVKVFASGEISRAVKLIGIRVSKGAKAAIEAAGGSVE